jgi:hypothetical protein
VRRYKHEIVIFIEFNRAHRARDGQSFAGPGGHLRIPKITSAIPPDGKHLDPIRIEDRAKDRFIMPHGCPKRLASRGVP